MQQSSDNLRHDHELGQQTGIQFSYKLRPLEGNGIADHCVRQLAIFIREQCGAACLAKRCIPELLIAYSKNGKELFTILSRCGCIASESQVNCQ